MSFYYPSSHEWSRDSLWVSCYITLWSVWWPQHFKLIGRSEYRSPTLCLLMNIDYIITRDNKIVTSNSNRGSSANQLQILCIVILLRLMMLTYLNIVTELDKCFIVLVPRNLSCCCWEVLLLLPFSLCLCSRGVSIFKKSFPVYDLFQENNSWHFALFRNTFFL